MLVNIIDTKGNVVKTVNTQSEDVLRNYPIGYKMEAVK